MRKDERKESERKVCVCDVRTEAGKRMCDGFQNRVGMDRALLRLRRRGFRGAVEPDSKARRAFRTGAATRAAAAATRLAVRAHRVHPAAAEEEEVAAEEAGSVRQVAPVPSAFAGPSLKVLARIIATAIAWCGRWPSIPLARLTLKRRRPVWLA